MTQSNESKKQRTPLQVEIINKKKKAIASKAKTKKTPAQSLTDQLGKLQKSYSTAQAAFQNQQKTIHGSLDAIVKQLQAENKALAEQQKLIEAQLKLVADFASSLGNIEKAPAKNKIEKKTSTTEPVAAEVEEKTIETLKKELALAIAGGDQTKLNAAHKAYTEALAAAKEVAAKKVSEPTLEDLQSEYFAAIESGDKEKEAAALSAIQNYHLQQTIKSSPLVFEPRSPQNGLPVVFNQGSSSWALPTNATQVPPVPPATPVAVAQNSSERLGTAQTMNGYPKTLILAGAAAAMATTAFFIPAAVAVGVFGPVGAGVGYLANKIFCKFAAGFKESIRRRSQTVNNPTPSVNVTAVPAI